MLTREEVLEKLLEKGFLPEESREAVEYFKEKGNPFVRVACFFRLRKRKMIQNTSSGFFCSFCFHQMHF